MLITLRRFLVLGLALLAWPAEGRADETVINLWQMKWVRVLVETSQRPPHVQDEGQAKGSANSMIIRANSLVSQELGMSNGEVAWDLTFTFNFSAPLTLEPGQEAEAQLSGSVAGVNPSSWTHGAGARVEWQVSRGGQGDKESVRVSMKKQSEDAVATAVVPPAEVGESLVLVASLGFCHDECNATWTYRPVVVDRETGEPLAAETCSLEYQSEVFVALCAEALSAALSGEGGEVLDCVSPSADQEATCATIAAVEADDLSMCPGAPGAREECAALVAAATGDLELAASLGPEAVGLLAVESGDFTILNRIEDRVAREQLMVYSLGSVLGRVLAGEETALPAAGICDGLLREWPDPDGQGYGEDNATVNRWVCKETVTSILAAASGDPAVCAERARGWEHDDIAERMPDVLGTGEPTPEEAVAWEEQNCLAFLADLEQFERVTSGDPLPLG